MTENIWKNGPFIGAIDEGTSSARFLVKIFILFFSSSLFVTHAQLSLYIYNYRHSHYSLITKSIFFSSYPIYIYF